MATTTVELYVDPACVFAWMTSRWLREVERQRDVEVRLHLMSIWLLNQRREIRNSYRELVDRSRGPARVAAACMDRYGDAVLTDFYTAMGAVLFAPEHRAALPFHEAATPAWAALIDQATRSALDALGLDPRLAAAVESPEQDDRIRASHERAVAPLGGETGTPVIHLDGAAFFGPVLSSVPRGDAAIRLFDAVHELAGQQHFHELKRGVQGRVSLLAQTHNEHERSMT